MKNDLRVVKVELGRQELPLELRQEQVADLGLFWNASERISRGHPIGGWGRTPDEAVAAYQQCIATPF